MILAFTSNAQHLEGAGIVHKGFSRLSRILSPFFLNNGSFSKSSISFYDIKCKRVSPFPLLFLMNTTIDVENHWSACPELHLGCKDLPFLKGFPGGSSGKEATCQYRSCKGCRFHLWVGKIPWRTKWQPTSVFLPEKSHGQRSLAGYIQSMGSQGVGHDWVDTAHSPFLNQPSSPRGVLGVEVCAGDFFQCSEVYPDPEWEGQCLCVCVVWRGGWTQRKKTEEVKVKVAQLCPILCNPMDYTVHRILQARILEWVAFLFSRGSFHPRDRTQVSHITGRFFTSWAISP